MEMTHLRSLRHHQMRVEATVFIAEQRDRRGRQCNPERIAMHEDIVDYLNVWINLVCGPSSAVVVGDKNTKQNRNPLRSGQ